MQAIHNQAAGAVMLEIVRSVDTPALVAEKLAGSAEAMQRLRLAGGLIGETWWSSISKPMLYASCPRSIRRPPFNVALMFPRNPAAQDAMVLEICKRCKTEPAQVLDRAQQALTRLWPAVRPITVHTDAGHA